MTEQPMTHENETDSEWTSDADGASEGGATTGSAPGGGYAPAEFENLQAESAGGRQDVNLEAIVDIPVTLSVEIGQTAVGTGQSPRLRAKSSAPDLRHTPGIQGPIP